MTSLPLSLSLSLPLSLPCLNKDDTKVVLNGKGHQIRDVPVATCNTLQPCSAERRGVFDTSRRVTWCETHGEMEDDRAHQGPRERDTRTSVRLSPLPTKTPGNSD